MRKNIPITTDQTVLKQLLGEFCQLVTLEKFDELTHSEYSRNTLLAMTKDWNLFVEFCQTRNVRPLPSSIAAIRQFIEKEARTRKYSTIRRYLVTIGVVHRLLSLPDPTNNALLRNSVTKLRLAKKGDAKQAAEFTASHLNILNEKLSSSSSAKDVRDLAIYYVMFECALKRRELKSLSRTQLELVDNKYLVVLNEHKYALSLEGTVAVAKWINMSQNDSQYVFRGIDRHGNIGKNQLDDSSIYRIVRHAGDLIGGDLSFSGQSTRVGAARELAKQGVRVKDIQSFGRWQSIAMPYQYLGNVESSESEMVKFKSIKNWD
ncbi:tyrosine-type recombinase/integrase [Vibrio paucivorans]